MLEVFYIMILAAGFPAGIILAKLCDDEIKNWRFRFKIISLACLMLAIVIFFTGFEYKTPVIAGLIFIIITSLTVVWKSYKKFK